MKRVALYMRVSTDAQAKEGDSIPAQKDALRKYATDRDDMIIVDEYIDDGISGTKLNRDEFQRMLSDVKNGRIDLVLVTKLDRLHRSLRNFLNMQDTFDQCHVNWLAIWEPMYDSSTPQGRMIINTMMNLAQFEAENTGQRIRQVFRYKVQQGEVLSGNQPVGYSIVDKKLVPNDLAPQVLDIYEHYAKTGNLNETQRYANVKYGWVRQKHVVKDLLRNRKYIGEFQGNPNYCEPIIPVDIFNEVQRQLDMNIKTDQKHIYIFSGLLKCGICGRRLGGNRNRKIYNTYRCPKHFSKSEFCPNSKVVSENALEKYLLENIKDIMEQRISDYEIEQKKVVDNSAAIKKVERKIGKLKELYVNDLIGLEEYKKDRDDLLEQLVSLERGQQMLPRSYDIESLKNLLNMNIMGIYNTMDSSEKRRFWRGIVQYIIFHPNAKERYEIVFY